MRSRGHIILVIAAALSVGCPKSETSRAPSSDLPLVPAPDDDACLGTAPLDRPLFGDTHIHTSFSLDAWGNGNTALDPDTALRFARGAPIKHPHQGSMQLDRPLDFAVVTDHAEFFDVMGLCLFDSSRPEFADPVCKKLRNEPKYATALQVLVAVGTESLPQFSPAARQNARQRMWQRVRNAANTHDAPCTFSALVGFEWTGGSLPYSAQRGNLHRNVIFRGNVAPAEPADALRFTHERLLWQELDRTCSAEDGCDALVIPHNSNLSINGAMWAVENDADAASRHRYERAAEIYQTKGSSECGNANFDPRDAGFDAECRFEAITLANPFQAVMAGGATTSDASTVGSALTAGLAYFQENRLNPLELGIVASTDTHVSAGGWVREDTFQGHGGIGIQSERGQLVIQRESSPGGLAAVWARHNTRTEIFDAIKRREVYGTSGPRIALRFYAVPVSSDFCAGSGPLDDAGLRALGAVPMGAAITEASIRWFVAEAIADQEPLESLQLVTLAATPGGASTRLVHEVTAATAGATRLCGVWPSPSPAGATAAYVRALERPTPRWTQFVCRRNPDLCPDGLAHETIRERAWSSPIWRYAPAD